MYRALSHLPVPTAAQFLDDSPDIATVVHVGFSLRDNARDVKRSLSSSIIVTATSASSTPTVDVGDIVTSAAALGTESICSPRRVVLRETADKRRYVEIWIDNVLELSKDVTDVHDSFYSESDEFFASLSFSPFELAVVYVAEAKESLVATDKFKFMPHLGEGLSGKKRPTMFVFRWDSSSLHARASTTAISPIVSSPVLFGQPVFSRLDKHKIFATGYEYTRDGRLLGLRWCYNRPAGIWEITLPSSEGGAAEALDCIAQKLTASDLSCRSPRISPNGKLFWLSHASAGPHAGTFSLHSCDVVSSERMAKILVETVWEPRSSDGFPGLYPSANLPTASFLRLHQDHDYLVVDSVWGSRTTVLLIAVADGAVKDLTPDSDGLLYSWKVLATDGKARILCSRSAPSIPHELVLGEFTIPESVSWRVVYKPYVAPGVRTALSVVQSSIVPIVGRGRTETIVVGPADSGPTPPCILFPHGGPHGGTTTAFNPSVASLALEGYTISQPNYSGSIGFGENFVRSLLGHCGSLDVKDCVAAMKRLVSLGISVEGPGKQFVMGGSHGGFLASHLIGQFPEIFTAAVIRNPVISTDPMSSDIPDWYFNEWNIDYPIYSSPADIPRDQPGSRDLPPRMTPELFKSIYSTSPISHVDAVQAHVLLHLGGSDQRVTPTHGLTYYHALKGRARNVNPQQNIEMHWFGGEGHSLDGVEAARVVWETTRDWFNIYRV